MDEVEVNKIGEEGRSVCHLSGRVLGPSSTVLGKKHVELFFVLYNSSRVLFISAAPTVTVGLNETFLFSCLAVDC